MLQEKDQGQVLYLLISSGVSPRSLPKFGLHPLIHTLLVLTLAQDVTYGQRFPDLGSEPPQTGHTFSVGLIIKLALHFWHLTLWSLTRLISSGSRVLLIWLFLFPVDVFGPTERFRDRIVSVAVPAKELFFTWGPGEVFVSARALLKVFRTRYLFLLSCHCPSYFSEDSFSYFFRRS